LKNKKLIERRASKEDIMQGYLYILSNESMPGIYKVGITSRTVEERVKELSNSTSIPTPFKIEKCYLVPNCQKAEEIVHKELKQFRISNNREFFKTDLQSLINACSTIYSMIEEKVNLYRTAMLELGELHYEKLYKATLDANLEKLKSLDYKLEDAFYDLYKFEGDYYYAIISTKFCTEEQYQEWVKEKQSESNEKEEKAS
jgi:hypothetical protein